MDGEELTEQETALYDRQIRVWGADAQRRLSKAHILVSGINGTIAEFSKNIVLAGVGSLTLMDDRLVTEDSLWANFLITPDMEAHHGKTLAEVCSDSLKDFNLMVRVSTEKGELANFDEAFFDKFDAIIITNCSVTTKKLVNEKCRKRTKRIPFYAVTCRDLCGEIFADLQNYSYAKKNGEDAVECTMIYPSFAEAIAVPWRSLPRKVSKLYFAMRVMERFESTIERDPCETSIDDLPNILELRKEICEAQSLRETNVPENLIERILVNPKEHPAVSAIIGGILGQEVIKAISGKGDPLKNFFFFDALDGRGIIEDISPSSDK